MGTAGGSVCLRVDLGGRCGGGKRDRTADLLHAMQALSQLSYSPAQRLNILGEHYREVNHFAYYFAYGTKSREKTL